MNAVPNQSPREGWRARLALQFQRRDERSVLTHRSHHGPLLVQRAFYPEADADTCHVYVIHPPGGVVSGDELQLDVQVQPRAHALLTTPAAGKFYRRHGERVARLTQTLTVNGGVLEWLPQENIFYPDSAVQLRTVVRLRGEARFIGWEVGCLGLPANERSIDSGSVRQCFELWRDEAPLLLERLNINQRCLDAAWGMAGHSTLGSCMAYPAGVSQLQQARLIAEQLQTNCAQLTIACTLIDGVLCCRGFAARADRLKFAFISLWTGLRESLIGRAATPPRIWGT